MLTKSTTAASKQTGRLCARGACFERREFFPLTSFAIKMKGRKSAQALRQCAELLHRVARGRPPFGPEPRRFHNPLAKHFDLQGRM